MAMRMSEGDDAPGFFPDTKLVEAALESAKIGVWSWDIASNRVTWSSNLEAIHRLPHGSFDGTFAFVQNDVHPDDRPQVRAAIEEALRTGKPRPHALSPAAAPRRPGALDRVAWRRVVMENGDAVRMFGTCRDVTDRVQAAPRIAPCAQASRRPSRGSASAR